MRGQKRQAASEWRFLGEAARDPKAEAPADLDMDTAHILRLVASVEREAQRLAEPDVGVQARVWQRALADAGTSSAAGPARPSLSGLRLRLAAAAALAVLILAGALSPAVQAQMHRIACWIPGIGIQSGCTNLDLVAARAVMVTRHNDVLRLISLYSNGSSTIIRLQLTGPDTGPVHVSMRDSRGKSYGFVGSSASGSPGAILVDASFAPLDAGVGAVTLAVSGAGPTWQVTVPVVPIAQSGLPAVSTGSPPVTLNGLTVRAAGVAADRQRTAVQIQIRGPAGTQVETLSRSETAEQALVLHDAADRSYREVLPDPRLPLPAPIQNITSGDGVTAVYNALFPPLRIRTGSAGLTIPMMTITQTTPNLQIGVPVRNGSPARTAVAHPYQLGAYHIRLLGAAIKQGPGGRDLVLRLDLGGWQDGRKLVHPMSVGVNGDFSSNSGYAGHNDVDQWTEVGVPMPENAGGTITVTLRGAIVAVRGPWRLTFPVGTSR